ncbi:uncharacterized protein A4U43_C01F1750 [Asparagus officinalis]|uniref:Uncharacterized protein n=1 Tax=Asparagus officinalis TaxID=4686 RepID=A0A5P1FQJ7_ASPOF|nr:uncharacterized protein A4U43_C01F1750 [Asparagus officinalis]
MPALKNHRHKNKSFCQKSTEMAMNITRLSSLYLSRITLGPRVPVKSVQARANDPVPVLLKDSSASKRLNIEHVSSLPSSTYLKEADEDGGVDERAEEFIRRFKDKNRHQSSSDVYKEASNCIPPPPRGKWAGYYLH